MKTYKLKKWYPSLPKGWETGIILCLKDKSRGYSPCNGDYLSLKLDKNEVEQNPEFWEEIVEKDYEILSFYYKNVAGKGDNYVDPDYIWYETYKGSGLWSRKGNVTSPYTINELLNHNSFRIHSIKRLSDSQIFTIGDRISYIKSLGSFILQQIEFECAPSDKNTGRLTFIHDHKTLGKWLNLKDLKKVVEQDFEILSWYDRMMKTINTHENCYSDIYSVKRLSDGEVFTIGDRTDAGIIKEFSICKKEDRILISFQNNIPCFLNPKGAQLRKLSKLFTTEDGVDIYEGDIIHQVNTHFSYYTYRWGVHHGCKGVPSGDYKLFSTKEAADEYIMMNKPYLSINDISLIFTHGWELSILKDIVKNKLK